MPAISGLGHVGLYCSDLALQESFYTEVLGLTKTDEDQSVGWCSSRRSRMSNTTNCSS